MRHFLSIFIIVYIKSLNVIDEPCRVITVSLCYVNRLGQLAPVHTCGSTSPGCSHGCVCYAIHRDEFLSTDTDSLVSYFPKTETRFCHDQTHI